MMKNNEIFNKYDLLMNPALGFISIASFLEGYGVKKTAPFILCFFAIPLSFQKDIRLVSLSSRSIQSFYSKLFMNQKNRLALLHKTVKSFRDLTFKSILIGVSLGFFDLDTKNGTVMIKRKIKIPEKYSDNLTIQDISKSSKKIGIFFSESDIYSIFKQMNTEA